MVRESMSGFTGSSNAHIWIPAMALWYKFKKRMFHPSHVLNHSPRNFQTSLNLSISDIWRLVMKCFLTLIPNHPARKASFLNQVRVWDRVRVRIWFDALDRVWVKVTRAIKVISRYRPMASDCKDLVKAFIHVKECHSMVSWEYAKPIGNYPKWSVRAQSNPILSIKLQAWQVIRELAPHAPNKYHSTNHIPRDQICIISLNVYQGTKLAPGHAVDSYISQSSSPRGCMLHFYICLAVYGCVYGHIALSA